MSLTLPRTDASPEPSGTLAKPRAIDGPVGGAHRVPSEGRVNHDRPVQFTFDGNVISALEGDTVASALLANGIHLTGRSFKYHRPRGILTAGSEEPNALIGTDRGPGRREPNTRATVQEVFEGLRTTSQNRWPSLRVDIGVVNDLASPLIGAGFYYKTFMKPRGFWDKVYEPLIRKAAGLGTAPDAIDPDTYTSRFAHADILVVGAGAAGIAAALAAGRAGGRVMLVDEQSEIGGGLLSDPDAVIDGQPAWDWLAAAAAELASIANVTVLPRATAIAYNHQNMVAVAERLTDHLAEPPAGMPRERLWRVRAKQVVLAQGALEKPMVFAGNDRPGVMLASAAHTYLKRYGVLVGEQIIVASAHDSAWATAAALAEAGAYVRIAEARASVPEPLRQLALDAGVECEFSTVATGTSGRARVHAVKLQPLRDGVPADGDWIHCDALLMAGGWTPSVHLFSHTKGKLDWDEKHQVFLPGESAEACVIAGAGAGVWGLSGALKTGFEAGASAASAAGFEAASPTVAVESACCGTVGSIAEAAPGAYASAKAFVDYQNDVTAKDVRQAVQEGMRSIEHVKRYTTSGMATDQGKSSNINALLIAAEALGKTPPEVGLTTFRPPYTPTTFGLFANHHRGATFDPERRTSIDAWAADNGAVFEPVSQWRRARYFPRSGEGMDAAVLRECATTRKACGVFDASTLGKIEVTGPDAAEFLNRIYTNPLAKLPVGKCRYALLLGEDGYIRDDGIIARLSETRFHVTTTTGGAARVLAVMEDYRQTEFTDLNVWLTSTTEQWATVAINGPKARKVLAPLIDGLDIAHEAFAHMSIAQCTVAGAPARVMRASFTGECGFEVNVPARNGRAVWEAIWSSAEAHGGCVYGTETMHVLRAEKGFIIVGQDTDGTVTPDDAGLAWALGKKKPDFVGKRGLMRPDLTAPGRKQLVGLMTEDPKLRLPEGAQVIRGPLKPPPMPMIGHVTSSYHSAALGRTFAMALIQDGRSLIGSKVELPTLDGGSHVAEVITPMFYDPENARLVGDPA
ncbi:MAG: sarcosine oxidase subunit alpha family protein [Pseudomonadota bacterium]